MTHGYASDVNGDDTVMDNPHCTVSFDSAMLNREQAVTLARMGDPSDQLAVNDAEADPSFDHSEIGDIQFHIPFETAVQMLQLVNVIQTDDAVVEDADGE